MQVAPCWQGDDEHAVTTDWHCGPLNPAAHMHTNVFETVVRQVLAPAHGFEAHAEVELTL